MIKKYIVDPNSFFNQSLLLSLFERTDCGFVIDGLTDNDRKDLFPINNKIKFSKNDVDVKSISDIKIIDLCDRLMDYGLIDEKYTSIEEVVSNL